jgi:mono/diheme cytochrome c family protein
MSTVVFVLVWVVVGLGLLLIALSGGPGGLMQRMHSQTRGTRKFAIGVFVVAMLVLGVGIPAAVVATVNARDSIPEADVTGLTASEKRGRDLFGKRCANCHTLAAANAKAQVGPDLDALRPPKAVVLNAIEEGRAGGIGQMAADLYTGEDAEDVANFVAKAVGQTAAEEGGGGGEEGGGGGGAGGEGGAAGGEDDQGG